MDYYTDKNGVKSSKKLDKIIDEARHYFYVTRGSWKFKNNTKKMFKLRQRFEKEVKRIGGVNYNFGDCLA
jgi:ribosomal protein L31